MFNNFGKGGGGIMGSRMGRAPKMTIPYQQGIGQPQGPIMPQGPTPQGQQGQPSNALQNPQRMRNIGRVLRQP